MYRGKVKFFNAKSRFGFITEEITGADYYFYIKNTEINFTKEELVSFDLKDSKKGKEAFNVKKINS